MVSTACRTNYSLPLTTCLGLLCAITAAQAADPLPIADAHVHYSHDSVELTPPSRVIELMRQANLKFALVSSSDDNGTQLLSDLAPNLIIPGLRPYRRRGELNSWFKDPKALAYVERLLATNRYATIGEFHLYGGDAELDIPKRIVELADEYNLVLHAHSDADAVERLLQQSPTIKVLWAHSGFDSPPEIAQLLRKHDRLWADLAFRSEVGSGGNLSDDWKALFTEFPDRLMLGTDTYTPERIYFIPEHAEAARVWLASLPLDLAEKVAWKNAHNLLMPVWNANRSSTASSAQTSTRKTDCGRSIGTGEFILGDDTVKVIVQPMEAITVSKAFAVRLTLCAENAEDVSVTLDAQMPAHGHGMNYYPEHATIATTTASKTLRVDGVVLHMPGTWQWIVDLKSNGSTQTLTHEFKVQ